MEDTLDSIRLLEEHLQLPKDFYRFLTKEDDWSFVIKLHALLESALSDLITHTLGRSELSEIFSTIEMSNSKTGKIAFAKALDLLESDHRGFVIGLSELRNHLVHRIKNVNFSLEEYFGTLNEEGQKRFVKAFGCGVKESFTVNGHLVTRLQFVSYGPKNAIWFAGLVTLDLISLKRRYSMLKDRPNQQATITPDVVDQLLADKKIVPFPSAPDGTAK